MEKFRIDSRISYAITMLPVTIVFLVTYMLLGCNRDQGVDNAKEYLQSSLPPESVDKIDYLMSDSVLAYSLASIQFNCLAKASSDLASSQITTQQFDSIKVRARETLSMIALSYKGVKDDILPSHRAFLRRAIYLDVKMKNGTNTLIGVVMDEDGLTPVATVDDLVKRLDRETNAACSDGLSF